MASKPAHRRAFLFDRVTYDIDRPSVGWIDHEFDALAEAEEQVRQPATRRTVGRGSLGERE